MLIGVRPLWLTFTDPSHNPLCFCPAFENRCLLPVKIRASNTRNNQNCDGMMRSSFFKFICSSTDLQLVADDDSPHIKTCTKLQVLESSKNCLNLNSYLNKFLWDHINTILYPLKGAGRHMTFYFKTLVGDRTWGLRDGKESETQKSTEDIEWRIKYHNNTDRPNHSIV